MNHIKWLIHLSVYIDSDYIFAKNVKLAIYNYVVNKIIDRSIYILFWMN